MAGPSPQQQYLRQQYAAPSQHSPLQAHLMSGGSQGSQQSSQHSSRANVYGGSHPVTANGQLPSAYFMTPGGPAPAAPRGGAPVKGPQAHKTWSDEEGADGDAHSFCTRFKFAIWLTTVLLLIGAAVGLSVTMAVVMHNRDSGNSSPPPSPDPVDPDSGSGGNGSSGDGNTGPLPVPTETPDWVPAGAQAIWWDDFEGNTLDRNKWSFDLGTGEWGWGNNELQTYTDNVANVRVAGGNLYITALRDGNSYTSGRINTKQHASFFPGMQLADGTTFTSVHVEARMQLPDPGQGLWPAFWMFPTELKYGVWAASGEIDVMESVNDMKKITQGLHFGGSDPRNVKNMTRTQQGNKQPYSDGFHTMAVDWAPDSIAFSVDGKVRATLYPRSKDPQYGWWTEAAGAPSNAPFNEPFYLILNLAVGGLWPGVPDDSTPFPATLAVDHVRVWGTPV